MCSAQFKDSKTYNNAVVLKEGGRLSVRNRHGNINIISWESDSLVVSATIGGQSKSLAKLQESMAKTNIDFRQSGSTIDISTIISETSFTKGINEVMSAAGVQNEISINYEIKVPKHIRLAITNKYGDIYIDKHEGKVDIELSHGNLRANSLNEVGYLRTNFGDVYIDHVNELKGNLIFSQLEIETAKSLDLISKSTEYELDKIGKLKVSSSNDKMDIDEVGDFNIVGSLSKVSIDDLTKSGNISLKYGKVKIKNIDKNVCTFMATTTRSTLELGIDKGGNKKISGMIGDGEIQNLNSLLKVDSKSPNLSATIGNADKANCTYQLSCQKSKIYFK
jgi:hypothetical protein